MTLRSQLYLLQLEDYDLKRYQQWIYNHPAQEVKENKGRLRWSPKAKFLYFLAKVTGSIPMASKLLQPFDYLFKNLIVAIAFLKLRLLHPKLVVIGITGSWGKTTTKEKLAELLIQKYQIYRTPENRNTLLGIADTVLRIPLKTEIFICEMGAYYSGDIKAICSLVRPKIGIITAIGPMHLERFGSLEAIKRTKYELFDSLPKNGLKITPEEDPIQKMADYFHISHIPQFLYTPHRLEIQKNNSLTIIDDSYNSNPVGFLLALKKLNETPGKPKILVTPGMIELGHMQFEENKKAAESAAKICDHIIVVGETNKAAFLAGLTKFKNISLVKDLEAAQNKISKLAKPGAVILFENDLPDHYF